MRKGEVEKEFANHKKNLIRCLGKLEGVGTLYANYIGQLGIGYG